VRHHATHTTRTDDQDLDPDRSALWILARTPALSAARYDALIERLTARGFEPARLRRTAQPVTPTPDAAP
jgi:hypothetical protein